MIEDEQTEFKQEYTDNIIKEIIAFLNSEDSTGGTIYVGADDSGNIVGLKDAKATEEKISNQIRSVIAPDCSMFISIQPKKDANDKEYLVIKVSKGVDVYFLKTKGYEGVYTRTGSCTIKAEHEAVQKLILDKEKLSYESSVCPAENLTFNYAKPIFEKVNINIEDESIQKTLHLRDLNNNFLNLAKILSDQNEFSIRIAVYEDELKQNFLDMKEFSGSIFEIYDKTVDYLKINSATYGIVNGTEREDIEEYPESILREILFNMCIHRSMELDGPNIINIYKNNKMEFISLGGLYKISLEDALSGVSYSRNKNLQAIFMRLKRVDSIGSGLKRITGFYVQKGLNVDIKALPSSFVVTIPHITLDNVSADKQLIVNYIRNHELVTTKELKDVVKKEKTSVQILLNELLEDKIIEKVGNGPSTKYKIK